MPMLLYCKTWQYNIFIITYNEVNRLKALMKANLIMDIPGKIKNGDFLPGTAKRQTEHQGRDVGGVMWILVRVGGA